jgi:hypothetical protein
MRVEELIASSLRLINILASNETPTGSEGADALAALNDMLDSWSTERLGIFTVSRQLFNLVSGTQVYTLGPNGTFNTARPIRVESYGVIDNSTGQAVEYPVEMVTERGWSQIPFKTLGTGGLFYAVWDDNAYPLRNLSFYPVPGPNLQVAIYSWVALTRFTSLTQDVTFPPGYAKALRFNLALDLAAEYGKEIATSTAAQALESKARIKTINAPEVLLQCEPGTDNPGDKYYAIWRG